MKLLLTSTGLENKKVRDFFISQFDTLSDKKACLIFTIREESDWQWLEQYDKELGEIGLRYDKINISEENNFVNLKEYDIYYVCGGNTFYILDRMRKTGMDKVLINAVKREKFYLGVSAGSIIPGPDIEVAGIGDINDINLNDLAGLNLVKYIVSPHYTPIEEKMIEEFKAKRKEGSVIKLTDDQAIFVEDGNMVLI
ncbi:MAG: Type 1 glutamine amidotransferase-like domain-containing protein [Parcubacteria group bacterium]|jgi:dipeptidase E